jgi:TnpA family transposase
MRSGTEKQKPRDKTPRAFNLIGYINEEIASTQWNEMLRFIATIKLKKTTASQLFRRLNSYSKQHPLYNALKEFGKIPKTLFILKYADDLEFR